MEYRVRFDRAALSEHELDVSKGDIITNVHPVQTGWLKGSIPDRVGYFPDHVVKLNAARMPASFEFVVLQNYDAQEYTNELTLRRGDIIRNVSQTSIFGWNNGTLVGTTGYFPARCVKIYNAHELGSLLQKIRFKVHTDYSAQNTAELTLIEGDYLFHAEYVKAGWYKGILTRKCVKVPCCHLTLSRANLKKKLLKKLEFVVTQDFTASSADELTICEGDVILHVGEAKDGWFKGELRGKMGLFPDNFVKLLNPPKKVLSKLEFIVTSDYQQTSQITIKKGDVIKKPKLTDKEWYTGTLVSRPGLFPDHIVKIRGVLFWHAWQKDEIDFIVIRDYTAKSTGYATIRTGEIIRQVRGKRGGWYKGRKVDIKGIFPESIVKLNSYGICPRELSLCELVVTSNYTATNINQLTLWEGDVIRNVEKAGCAWFYGTLVGKTGLFPDNLFEIVSVEEDESDDELLEPAVNTNACTLKTVKSVLEILGLLKCQNCLEIPDYKIFQCVNGHIICRKCIQQIEKCNECNVSFKVKGKFIKNRVAASLALSFNSLPRKMTISAM